ncbi:MAG: WYL domain-containing protein [Nitrospirae bacterium]|nr:WYL domain-containing protein [Nitrospirota bacterium]
MGSKNIFERFIWFDDKVRRGRFPNATKLSGKFEISIKTAQRDIEFMRDRLHCPFEYNKNEKGYYYKDDSFSLPLTYLSSDELTTLLLARKMLQDVSGAFIKNELTSVVGKITGILQRHSEKTKAIDSAFSFQFIKYSPVEEVIFKNALTACLNEKTPQMGTWHLIAFCHVRNEIRDFVLGRISNLSVQEQTFTVRKDFDLQSYLKSSFGLYKGDPKEEVTLRFSPRMTKWVKNQIWHKGQKTRMLDNGSLELSFPVASFMEIEMEVLKYGAEVEVVSPEPFRQLIKTEAQNILKLY